jgi:hypothetical protein
MKKMVGLPGWKQIFAVESPNKCRYPFTRVARFTREIDQISEGDLLFTAAID